MFASDWASIPVHLAFLVTLYEHSSSIQTDHLGENDGEANPCSKRHTFVPCGSIIFNLQAHDTVQQQYKYYINSLPMI